MRALGGVGSSMFTVSAMALLLRTVAADQRGRATGAYQAGFLFGGVAGPAVGGLVVGISLRAPFIVYAVTLAAATVVCLVWLRDPVPQTAQQSADQREGREQSAGQVAGAPAHVATLDAVESANEVTPETDEIVELVEPDHHASPPADTTMSLGTALRNRGYLAAIATNLGNGFSIFGLRSALVPLFVVEGLRQGPGIAGLGFLVAAATQAVLLLPAGRLADQRGRRPAMIMGNIASVGGMVMLAFSGNVWMFYAAMAVLGISAAFLGPAPAAVVGDVTNGERSGSPVAVFQMVSDFGAIIGPLAAGLVLDSAGFGAAFAVGAVIMGIGLAASLVMPETLRKTPTAAS